MGMSDGKITVTGFKDSEAARLAVSPTLGFVGLAKTAGFNQEVDFKTFSIHSCHRRAGRTLTLATFPPLTGGTPSFSNGFVSQAS